MGRQGMVMVALSGGVDSAVAAWRLREQGHEVQCLHMTNWEDDGYCEAAEDFQDARRVCRQLGLPLHRVNFAREYRAQVFAEFLREHEQGRTPNPDVLCNREIKFGVLARYAARLGAERLATGHYARLETRDGVTQLFKGRDARKDQSYFLHAVGGAAFEEVLFPLGDLDKDTVRDLARGARIPVAEKKDSTGICFIGERPFAAFLGAYLRGQPGPIETPEGETLGEHRGLAFYTLGQRQGLGIGGIKTHGEEPWYVAAKRARDNTLIVVQGGDHPLLYQDRLLAADAHWVNGAPQVLRAGAALRCRAKTRYRQADQDCTVKLLDGGRLEVSFDRPQRSITPGQYVVFYDRERCLGGARIEHAASSAESSTALAVQAG